MRGHVSIRSQEGAGSRFTVDIPFWLAPSGQRTKSSEQPRNADLSRLHKASTLAPEPPAERKHMQQSKAAPAEAAAFDVVLDSPVCVVTNAPLVLLVANNLVRFLSSCLRLH